MRPPSKRLTQWPIPLAEPTFLGNEGAYLQECLVTNWVSCGGPFVTRFENALRDRCIVESVVTTSTGTAALHLALIVAGVEPNTEVVMPGIGFVAPANAVRYCGAWPTFVDVSITSWQWDVSKVDNFLSKDCERRASGLWNMRSGRRVSALLPVHLLGGMCDLDSVGELARQYGLAVVEDAAECMGALYKGRPIGSALTADSSVIRLTATSFNGNKVITTGAGGAILTNEARLAARAKHLSTTAKRDRQLFIHDEVGFNYCMTNLAAALGVAQIEQLDQFLVRKRRMASCYDTILGHNQKLVLQPHCKSVQKSHWLYTLMARIPSAPLICALNADGIQARPIWTPLYRLPAFANECYIHSNEFSECFHEYGICLPSGTGITEDQIDVVSHRLLARLR